MRKIDDAWEEIGKFKERNKRRWCSCTYINSKGFKVVVATHPSRADWTTCAAATHPT